MKRGYGGGRLDAAVAEGRPWRGGTSEERSRVNRGERGGNCNDEKGVESGCTDRKKADD